MRAPLSIVIPTLNAAEDLPVALRCLGEALEAGLVRELVISDGGSSDETRSIADQAGANWVTGDAGRGGQLRRGCAATQGDWLLVLHADTELEPGYAVVVQNFIATHPSKAGYFRLAFRATGIAPRLVAGWANLRSRWFGLPYGDQGLLIPRVLYDQVGGYQDIPLMEDVATARALKGHLVVLDGVASTSAVRYLQDGWLRRGARNLWTLMRYLQGVAPERLVRDYEK